MNDNSMINYKKMLLRNAYKPFTDDVETVDEIDKVKSLSIQQQESYKTMSKEIENKPLPLFSKNRKDFRPEDFYDEDGNEVEEPIDSQEKTSEDTANDKTDEEKSTGDCLSCRYFYITWDLKSPKGCKFFKVKTDIMPSELVHKSLGYDCNHYFNKFSKKFDSVFGDIIGESNNEKQD